MKGHLKTIAKISGKSIWAWTKIILLAGFFFFVTLAIGLFLVADNPAESGPGGHGGGPLAFLVLFIVLWHYLITDPFPTILLIFSFLSIPLFFFLANKYAVTTFLSNLYQNKLADVMENKLQLLLQKVFNKFPALFEKSDWKTVNLKLIQESKEDPSISRVYRKSIAFGLKKINMDDVNLSDPDLSLSHLITQKLKDAVNDTLEPTLKPVWIVYGVGLVLIILAFIFNVKAS